MPGILSSLFLCGRRVLDAYLAFGHYEACPVSVPSCLHRIGWVPNYPMGRFRLGGGVPIRPIIITGPGQLVRFEMLARLSDAT